MLCYPSAGTPVQSILARLANLLENQLDDLQPTAITTILNIFRNFLIGPKIPNEFESRMGELRYSLFDVLLYVIATLTL
jgi:hypothetical protein